MNPRMRNYPDAPPRNPLYKGRQYSAVTKAPRGMLDRDFDDPVRLRWMADNCDTLARFMRSLRRERHDQGTWNTQSSTQARHNECGTAACALGWAAFSQTIPGLQYAISPQFFNSYESKGFNNRAAWFEPTIDGKLSDYFEVGRAFFGEETYRNVFAKASLDLDEVVDRLRGYACKQHLEAIYEERRRRLMRRQ